MKRGFNVAATATCCLILIAFIFEWDFLDEMNGYLYGLYALGTLLCSAAVYSLAHDRPYPRSIYALLILTILIPVSMPVICVLKGDIMGETIGLIKEGYGIFPFDFMGGAGFIVSVLLPVFVMVVTGKAIKEE